MIALHGLWLDSELCVWGEDGGVAAACADDAMAEESRDAGGEPLHPFALSIETLRLAVGDGWEGLLAADASEGQIAARLPTVGGWPEPSPPLRSNGAEQEGEREVTLGTWLLPCLRFSPADAIDLLTLLPGDAPERILVGASLRYWSRLAALVGELLASQRFVPDVLDEAEGRHRAHWRVLLGERHITRRVVELISSMPPVCRCAWRNGDPPQSVGLVEDFLQRATDAMIRRSLADDPLVQSLERPAGDRGAVEVPWLRALVGTDAYLPGRHEDREELARQVRQWVGQLDETAGHARFRTAFRLHAPALSDEEELGENGEGGDGLWTVTFHMQAADDPGVVLDAEHVWATRRRGLGLLRRQYQLLAEQLEADLRRAAHLFAPLEQVLEQPEPVSCALDTEGAYGFLQEVAPLLQLNGFGVHLPAWWTGPGPRLGLRLQVDPIAPTPSSGQTLGLDALVDYRWEVALGDTALTEGEFNALCQQGRSLVRLRGRWVEAPVEALRSAREFLNEKTGDRVSVFEALRLSLGDTRRAGLPVTGMAASGWLEAALNSVGTASQTITDLPQPESFRGSLRPYQLKALSWLAFLDRYGMGGCLADDMGLGKTIELIAMLLHERQDGAAAGPTLLVVPMSLVGNWRRELERFAPEVRVMVHHGAQRLSGDTFLDEVAVNDVVISTYALAYRDQEHLARVRWHRVVLDEAQNIKNPSAKQTAAIRALRCRRRLALTGTPLENHLSELWSIMEFLNPGLLGSASEFRREFAVPIEKHHETERANQLRRLIRPFVLRRRKDDPSVIVDLPEKMEMKVFCNLSREQAALYQSVVDDMLGDIELSVGMRRRGLVLSALTRLKQVCDHPLLAFEMGPRPAGVSGRSGKCERLVEMLEEVLAEGDRALIFTQFRKMGQLLQPYLEERLGCGVLFLHGQTTQRNREEMVERFQTGDGRTPVFLLSLRAGGFGLNLTAANHVFHFDRWWNPAVEDQASDRAHRIGQVKTVQVHKFVCIGTLEERIDRMLEEKRDLADRIIGSGEKWLTELSTEDLREVLTLSREAVAED